MPLTLSEGLADIPEALALFNAYKSAVASLPAPPAVISFAQYAKGFGAADGSVLALAAGLADTLKEQAKS
jgi:hypothetical protein